VKYGIVGPSQERRIRRHEVLNADLSGQAALEVKEGFAVEKTLKGRVPKRVADWMTKMAKGA
jgi:hypothetical protein